MGFRTWNNRKNNWLRYQKGKWAARLLGSARPVEAYNPQKIRKILLLRNDNKLGDMTVSSVLLRALTELFPDATLDVVAGKDGAVLLEHNPCVHQIYRADQSLFVMLRLGRALRAKRYDLYIDTDEKPTLSSLVFLKLLAPRYAFGFNRNNYPLYNLSQRQDLDCMHITLRYETVLRRLGYTKPFNKNYEVFLGAQAHEDAHSFLQTLTGGGRLIVVCPLAASRHRSFCRQQVAAVAAYFASDRIVVLGEEKEMRRFWGRGMAPSNLFPYYGGLLAAAALAQRADVLLTVDTFWVHLACAVSVPAVAVYHGNYAGVWGPVCDKVSVLSCDNEQRAVSAVRLVKAMEERLTAVQNTVKA